MRFPLGANTFYNPARSQGDCGVRAPSGDDSTHSSSRSIPRPLGATALTVPSPLLERFAPFRTRPAPSLSNERDGLAGGTGVLRAGALAPGQIDARGCRRQRLLRVRPPRGCGPRSPLLPPRCASKRSRRPCRGPGEARSEPGAAARTHPGLTSLVRGWWEGARPRRPHAGPGRTPAAAGDRAGSRRARPTSPGSSDVGPRSPARPGGASSAPMFSPRPPGGRCPKRPIRSRVGKSDSPADPLTQARGPRSAGKQIPTYWVPGLSSPLPFPSPGEGIRVSRFRGSCSVARLIDCCFMAILMWLA